NTIGAVMWPERLSAARAKAWTAARHCPRTAMRRRSKRSASTPVRGAITRAGRNSAMETAPSHVPECVRFQVSQPTATRWTQVPTTETELAAVNRAKLPRKVARIIERSTMAPYLQEGLTYRKVSEAAIY